MTDPIMKTKNTREYRLYHNITTPEQEMQGLEAIVRNLKQEREKIIAERDEARRDVCKGEAIIRLQRNRVHRDSEEVVRMAKEIAVERGWDCFKENTDE
jgi:ribonuclease D